MIERWRVRSFEKCWLWSWLVIIVPGRELVVVEVTPSVHFLCFIFQLDFQQTMGTKGESVLSAEKTKKEWTHNGFVKNVTCGCVTLALSIIVFCLGTKETNYINIYPVLKLSFFFISMQTFMFLLATTKTIFFIMSNRLFCPINILTLW